MHVRCSLRLFRRRKNKSHLQEFRRVVLAAAAAVIAGGGAMYAQSAGGPEILVTGGMIRGQTTPDGGTLFRGIPYAAPPLGDLRWQAPYPVVPWSGVRDAMKPGAPCLQPDLKWNSEDAAASSEDCLKLAVHSPKHDPDAKLPVMVWIHGGANMAGSGIGYSGSDIVRHGVVLVTLQYRLGVFGFLSLKGLRAESGTSTSGNFAIQDQIAALKWVRDNIARFGGDPKNITIFGQSAGAQDVGLLMVTPLARGLFQKAIEESGTAAFGFPARTLAQNEKIGSDLAHLLGVPENATPAAELAALRRASPKDLIAAGQKLKPPVEDAGFIWDQPVVDGYVLPYAPAEVYARGGQAPVPLIIGNNARELPVFGDESAENVRHVIDINFGQRAAEAYKLYHFAPGKLPPEDPLLGSLATIVATDVMFRLPQGYVATRQQAVGGKVWRYQMDVARYGSKDPVWHSSELGFVFDTPPAGVTAGTWPPMQVYWTNFAKSGDPNGNGMADWPEFGAEGNYLEFSKDGPRTGTDLQGDLMRLRLHP